jgi:dTDP-glucose 4,6-dehydratase
MSAAAKLFVLGSNSFGGASLIDGALSAGWTVEGCNRSPEAQDVLLPYARNARRGSFRFHHFDINNDFDALSARLRDFAPDVVVDFAGQGMVAPSWEWPEQWYHTNIVSKVRLHDVLRRLPSLQKYIRVSTPEVYGDCDYAVDEAAPMRPSTPYAVSHAAIDLSLQAFQRHYGFPVVLTRFANFYGAGQQLYRIIPRAAICGLSGRKLPLHGGGTSVRAFIHGHDIASALLAVAERGRVGETYHFSTDEFVSIRQLVELVAAKLGVDFAQMVELAPERPGKDQMYKMDWRKAREELGWQPAVTLDAGLGGVIEWVRQNIDTMLALPHDYIHKV